MTCNHDKRPIPFYNLDTGQYEVDCLVCVKCLQEFDVSPMTMREYAQMIREERYDDTQGNT